MEVDDECNASLTQAKQRFDSHVGSLDIHPFILEKYGKKACKKWGISPDSLMQLGFQVMLKVEIFLVVGKQLN